MIVEALAAQAASQGDDGRAGERAHAATDALLPGLTGWQRVVVPDDSSSIGCSLASLELRARTGATVLAIQRGESGVAVPDANEPLRAGDVLAITGSHDAIAAAVLLIRRGGCAGASDPGAVSPGGDLAG